MLRLAEKLQARQGFTAKASPSATSGLGWAGLGWGVQGTGTGGVTHWVVVGEASRRDVSRLGQVQLFSGLQLAMQLTSCWGGLAGRGINA